MILKEDRLDLYLKLGGPVLLGDVVVVCNIHENPIALPDGHTAVVISDLRPRSHGRVDFEGLEVGLEHKSPWHFDKEHITYLERED